MGAWRGLRVAFAVGSVFMILLIIVYWDDVGGGFNLYPLQQDPRRDSVVRDPVSSSSSLHPLPRATPVASHSVAASTARPSTTFAAAARETTPPFLQPAAREETEREEEHGEVEREERREDKREEEEREYAEEKGQEERKRKILDMCAAGEDWVDFPGKSRTFEQIPNRELDHLIVDDTHQIIYCYVPKVACTNWKRVMVVLSGSLVSPMSGRPYTDPESVPPDLVHNSTLHLTFAKFWRHYGSLSRHLMALKLQHYTKFLFVRDPFVRLISAFRNKFGRPNEDFYQQFGSVMLRRYANVSGSMPATAAEAFAAGIRPSFQQFIKYLLDPQTEKEAVFNEHWRQVYRLCHPCQIQYDFIGKLETLETDSEQLLKLLGVDHLLHFPSGARNRTATSWESDWFARIPLEMRKELYELYEPDFELFGYPKPDSVLHR